MQLSFSAYIGLYNKQSSANKLQEDNTQLGKSLIYTKNNSGPRMVPSGTPLITSIIDDWEPLQVTYWVQLLKKDEIHSRSHGVFHSVVVYARENDVVPYQML